MHPKEKPYSPLVAQYDLRRSQVDRHTSTSSIPTLKTSRNDIHLSYNNTIQSAVPKDSWPLLNSLPKHAFTATSCVLPRKNICAPQLVQPEPWPVLWQDCSQCWSQHFFSICIHCVIICMCAMHTLFSTHVRLYVVGSLVCIIYLFCSIYVSQ